jgi:hypothetical protein
MTIGCNFKKWAEEITDDANLVERIAKELKDAYLLGYKKREITDDQIDIVLDLLEGTK